MLHHLSLGETAAHQQIQQNFASVRLAIRRLSIFQSSLGSIFTISSPWEYRLINPCRLRSGATPVGPQKLTGRCCGAAHSTSRTWRR